MFQPSVLGMQSQSQALSVISGNVANVTTTAYKRSDTGFETLLSRTWASSPAATGSNGALSRQSDIAGAAAKLYARVSAQGELATSERDLDLAIDGAGFFLLSAPEGTVYSRDGRFGTVLGPEISVPGADGTEQTTNESYLADPNGFLLQGWRVRADGSFPTDAASLGPVRIDPAAFRSDSRATAGVALSLNLPATDDIGSQQTYGFDVIDQAGVARPLTAVFSKTAGNTWDLAIVGAADDQVSISPTATVAFTQQGGLASAPTYQVSVARPDGTAAQFTLDLTGSTQFAGSFNLYEFSRDGHVAGSLAAVSFDAAGYVDGQFSNGRSERLYRLPIATFANPDGLLRGDGGVWAVSETSGLATVQAAGDGGSGDLTPKTLELSNVDLADQFSRMILTQNAYNSSATAFRTMDEVVETARDLKR
jgi:flagellar hook protein FlgE